MKEFVKIDRLNEDHTATLPENYLNMTIGEILDSLENTDTDTNNEYEMVEGIFLALKDQIMASGYEGERDMSSEGEMEQGDEMEDVKFTDGDDFPNFQQSQEDDGIDGDGTKGIENFNF